MSIRGARGRSTAVLVLVASSIGAGVVMPAVRACASTSSRAALIVRFSATDQREFCAPLPATSASAAPVTGFDLLRAAGFRVSTKDYNGMGEFICAVDGLGTSLDDCPAQDNSFWGYYILRRGRWAVSDFGASTERVEPGDVQAWVWQPRGRANRPTIGSLDQVCADPGTRTISLVSASTGRKASPAVYAALIGALVILVGGWRLSSRALRAIGRNDE